MKTQKFSYLFTPAGFISNFVPLIVVLYGEQDINMTDFEYKMWNVLQVCSLETNTEQEKLLKELIIETAETYECEEYVFMYGEINSMNEAISQGLFREKNAVYADASQMNHKEELKKVLDIFERMDSDEYSINNFS